MPYQAIHVALDRTVREISISTVNDIAETVQHHQIEHLTSADHTVGFWFSSLLPAAKQLNQFATDLLMTATRSTAATVPLLHGDVVLAAHDPSGALSNLTNDHLACLRSDLSWRQQWVLDWRYTLAERRDKKQFQRAVSATPTHINSLSTALAARPQSASSSPANRIDTAEPNRLSGALRERQLLCGKLRDSGHRRARRAK
jgi:hypothetical protein